MSHSHEKSAVHFDEIGNVISLGDKRLRLSPTHFKIMQAVNDNFKRGRRTSETEIKKLIQVSDKSVYQHLYNLRNFFNNTKFFPLRLYYVRRNGDKWYEMEVKL